MNFFPDLLLTVASKYNTTNVRNEPMYGYTCLYPGCEALLRRMNAKMETGTLRFPTTTLLLTPTATHSPLDTITPYLMHWPWSPLETHVPVQMLLLTQSVLETLFLRSMVARCTVPNMRSLSMGLHLLVPFAPPATALSVVHLTSSVMLGCIRPTCESFSAQCKGVSIRVANVRTSCRIMASAAIQLTV